MWRLACSSRWITFGVLILSIDKETYPYRSFLRGRHGA